MPWIQYKCLNKHLTTRFFGLNERDPRAIHCPESGCYSMATYYATMYYRPMCMDTCDAIPKIERPSKRRKQLN